MVNNLRITVAFLVCIIIIFVHVFIVLWLKRIYAEQTNTVFIKQITLKVNISLKHAIF